MQKLRDWGSVILDPDAEEYKQQKQYYENRLSQFMTFWKDLFTEEELCSLQPEQQKLFDDVLIELSKRINKAE